MNKNKGPFAVAIERAATKKVSIKDEAAKISKQQSFNDFIKAPAFLLAYLYFVSICYHFGYWSDFEIDIFNFYSVQDLVKGATHGMRETFSFLLMFAIPYLVMYTLFIGTKNTSLLLWIASHKILFLFFNAFALAIMYIVTHSLGNEESYRELTQGIIPDVDNQVLPKGYSILIIVFLFSYISTTVIRKHFAETADFTSRVSSIFLYSFAIALPPISYLSGINTNLLIRRGVEFDYIFSSNIVKENKVYKYLGKASEHYFLSTLDGTKTIVIKTDSIQPLVLNHFHADNLASVNFFLKEYNKYLKENKNDVVKLKEKNMKKNKTAISDTLKIKTDSIK